MISLSALSLPFSLCLFLTHYSYSGQFHSGGWQHGGCVQDQDSEQLLWGGLCQCSPGQRVSRPLPTEGQAAIQCSYDIFHYMYIYGHMILSHTYHTYVALTPQP